MEKQTAWGRLFPRAFPRALWKASPLLLFVVVTLGPPLWFCAEALLSGSGVEPLSAVARARQARLLWTTVKLTAGATLWATALGVLAAWAIHAAGRSGTVWRLLCPLPLLLPPTVIGVGWTHLLGRSGSLNQAWMSWTGSPEPLFNIFSPAGCVFVWGFCWFPLVTLTTLVGLRALGASALAPARLYAGAWRRGLKIVVPLLLPYVATGAAIAAWLTLSDFDLPSLLLLKTSVFPLEIFGELSAARMENVPRLCLSMAGVALVILGIRQVLVRKGGAPTVDERWSPFTGGGNISRRRLVGAHTAAAAVFIPALFVPLFGLVRELKGLGSFQQALQTARDEMLRSVVTATAAATFAVVLGGLTAASLLGRRGRMRTWAAVLVTLPLAVPGAIHGLGWLTLLQAPGWRQTLLESPAILVLTAAARYVPLAVFVLAAAHGGINRRLGDAAKISGAGPLRRLTRIHAPLLFPAYLTAFFICYAFALGESAAAVLTAPPDCATLPIRISSLLHFGKDELVAALCLLQAALVILPFGFVTLLTGRALEIRLE